MLLLGITLAQTLRNDFEADIVILMTNGNYGQAFGWAAGLGPNDSLAYALVQTGAATTGRFTFAHEVAHLFGGGHNDDPRDGIPHAHKFKKGKWRLWESKREHKTVLHKLGEDEVRIQHFSNPDVKYQGGKTGKEGTNDNVLEIKNSACTIAQFRETIEPFGVNITGQEFGCPCDYSSLHATTWNGTAGATYSYQWATSTDGISWTILSTYTGNGASVILPCTIGEVVFIRVIVTASDGNTATDHFSVTVANTSPGNDAGCAQEYTTNPNNGFDITLSPNPSSKKQLIKVIIENEGVYSLNIRDNMGRVVQTIFENKNLSVGEYRYDVNINQKGIYFVNCLNDKGNLVTLKGIKL